MVGNRANLSEIWTAPCTQCAFIVLPSRCSSESGRDKTTQLIVWHCSIALFSSFKLLHSCWEDNHSWKIFYWQKAALTAGLRIKVIDAQCKTKTYWGTHPSMTKHPPSGDQYSSEMSIPKIVDTVGYKVQLHFPLNYCKNFRLSEQSAHISTSLFWLWYRGDVCHFLFVFFHWDKELLESLRLAQLLTTKPNQLSHICFSVAVGRLN